MGQVHQVLTTTLGLFCTAQLCTLPIRAQEASAAETAAARALAVDGLKLARAGNCTEAVPKLERAEKLYHSTVVASRLGECYVDVGRLVEGTEVLRKVLRDPQPSEPGSALVKALERAQRVLDAAMPRIAGLTIKLANIPDVSIKVDGSVVASALLDTEIPSDPGEHTVEASAPGYLTSTTRVSVAAGERRSVTLTLTRDPNARVSVEPRAGAVPIGLGPIGTTPPSKLATAGVVAQPAPPVVPNRTAAYLSFGLGGAGLVTGAVLGLMTFQRHKDLDSSCPDRVCSLDRQGDLDRAKRLGNFSTIAVGVGAAGVALGTLLYFTAGAGSSDRAGLEEHRRRGVGFENARVAIGLAGVDLGADF